MGCIPDTVPVDCMLLADYILLLGTQAYYKGSGLLKVSSSSPPCWSSSKQMLLLGPKQSRCALRSSAKYYSDSAGSETKSDRWVPVTGALAS